MRDLSKVILRGTISDAPKTRTFNDRKVAGFTVQTTTRERDDGDYERERTAYHRISAWGRNAELVEPLEQGAPVYVEGRLQTRKSEREGQDVYFTEVRADIVRPLESAEPQMNRSILLGNLGRKNDLKEFDWGAVLNLAVPTSESWTSRSGEDGEETEWHSVVAFRTLAQQADREIDKGQRIFVIGYLQTRKYKDRNGQERRSTETVAQTIQGSGKRTDSPGNAWRGEDDFTDRVREKDRETVRETDQETSGVDTSSDDGDDVPF